MGKWAKLAKYRRPYFEGGGGHVAGRQTIADVLNGWSLSHFALPQ